MKRKYFALSKPLKINEFEEYKKPMGWLRLNKENIENKKGLLTKEELKVLERALK